MKKKKKGFTLVELLMGITISAMVFVIIGIIFNILFGSHSLIDKEASIQSDIRTSMMTIDRSVQDATAVFVLDDTKYDGTKNSLAKMWNYIGLSEDGSQVLNYKWNEDKQDWDISVLSTSTKGIAYNLIFNIDKNYQDNRLVNYTLDGKYTDTENKLAIKTAIASLKSKQIFSKVGEGKKGIAIAYRKDKILGQVNATVSFVFDTSGSMAWDMNGRRVTSSRQTSRLQILQTEAKNMVDSLVKLKGVNVNFISFGTYARYIQKDFADLNKNVQTAYNSISSLKASGVTNPGDGLRYSMASLKENKSQLKYVVLLTDGIPNTSTVTRRYAHGDREFGYVSNLTRASNYNTAWYGNPSFDLSLTTLGIANPYTAVDQTGEAGSAQAIEYTRQVSEKYGTGVNRVSVIGFSALDSDKKLGQSLKDSIKNRQVDANYYDAQDAESLKTAFSGIKEQIEQDLWFVSGP